MFAFTFSLSRARARARAGAGQIYCPPARLSRAPNLAPLASSLPGARGPPPPPHTLTSPSWLLVPRRPPEAIRAGPPTWPREAGDFRGARSRRRTGARISAPLPLAAALFGAARSFGARRVINCGTRSAGARSSPSRSWKYRSATICCVLQDGRAPRIEAQLAPPAAQLRASQASPRPGRDCGARRPRSRCVADRERWAANCISRVRWRL